MNGPAEVAGILAEGYFDAVVTHALVRNALLAGLLASVACGVVGTYVVVRRITYLAGGIAHCVLGGIGAAIYLNCECGLAWLEPLHGAVAAALLAGVIIGVVSLRFQQREDTVISALWAVGMATGVLFIRATRGYQTDPMSYLIGTIAIVNPRDLWLMAGLDVLVVSVCLLRHRQFQAICFDEEFTRARGVRVDFYYLLLLSLTALTVVLLVNVVGIVLAIALLTLPVAIAGQFARRLWHMMVAAIVLSMLFLTAGLAVSYGPGLPGGATAVVLAGGAFLMVLIARALWRRLRGRAAAGGAER